MLGILFGVFVGATPGLTATMAVALIVPISFYLEPNAGLAMIIGVSFTAIFAGDIPATYTHSWHSGVRCGNAGRSRVGA